MSYARWSEGDLYVFGTGDEWICMCCRLLPTEDTDYHAATVQQMLAHVLEHESAGHIVPARCIERLRVESHA